MLILLSLLGCMRSLPLVISLLVRFSFSFFSFTLLFLPLSFFFSFFSLLFPLSYLSSLVLNSSGAQVVFCGEKVAELAEAIKVSCCY